MGRKRIYANAAERQKAHRQRAAGEQMPPAPTKQRKLSRPMRLAAAVKWYELRILSQERAARVAGLSRAEFLQALGRFDVSPFQYGADELQEEAGRE